MDTPNLTRPALILGAGLVLGAAVLAGGMWLALDRAMTRFERSVTAHADGVRHAGERVGSPVAAAVTQAGDRIGPPVADAVTRAGDAIAHPQVRVVEAIPIREPLQIRGIADDGALPVNASIGK